MKSKIFSKKLILIVISLIIISLASQLFSREISKMNRDVVLISFTAQFIGNLPIICWTTQSETNNAGWNIYRGEYEGALNNGDAIHLNSASGLIPGAGTTTEPTEYSFEDFFYVYVGNTYYYWLESVDYSGETEIHGPISLTISAVVLISFTAQFIGNLPIICWTTQSEYCNSGWNIYRGEYEGAFINGDAIQINTELIEGSGTTTQPTNYVFEDPYNVISGNEYWYWLESVDSSGEVEIYGPISLTIPVAVNENNLTNSGNQLLQNYPNPFNPSTTISFSIPNDSNVELVIYNIKGQKVKTIVADNKFDKGNYSVIWNGDDESGKYVSSGLYFYKMILNGKSETIKKCLLLK